MSPESGSDWGVHLGRDDPRAEERLQEVIDRTRTADRPLPERASPEDWTHPNAAKIYEEAGKLIGALLSGEATKEESQAALNEMIDRLF